MSILEEIDLEALERERRETNKLIAQAENMIAARFGIDFDTASTCLYSLANVRGRKTSEIAYEIVSGSIPVGIFNHPAFSMPRFFG